MKNLFYSLLVAVGIATAGFVGCSTTGSPLTAEQKAAKLERVSILVKNLSRDLVIYGAAKDHEKTVEASGTALGLLDAALSDSDTPLSPTVLQGLLRASGLVDKDNPEVVLALGTLLTTYELLWADQVSGKLGEYEDFLQVAKALRDGLVEGLAVIK